MVDRRGGIWYRSIAVGAEQIYDGFVIDELRAAVNALNEGNTEPFLALIDQHSEWRGIPSGHMWWKQKPS